MILWQVAYDTFLGWFGGLRLMLGCGVCRFLRLCNDLVMFKKITSAIFLLQLVFSSMAKHLTKLTKCDYLIKNS